LMLGILSHLISIVLGLSPQPVPCNMQSVTQTLYSRGK
jgi:hypothetical protein